MIEINVTGGPEKGFDLFVRLLPGVLTQALADASRRVTGTAISQYMRDAGREPKRRRPDDNGPLRIVTGRLARSLTGARKAGNASEAIYEIDTDPTGGVRLTFGSRVPYARIHEFGGFAGREQQTYIPGRPYLNPALQDEEQQIRLIFGERIDDLIKQVERLG